MPLAPESAYADPAAAAGPRGPGRAGRPRARRRRHRRRRDRRRAAGRRGRRWPADLPFAFVRKPGTAVTSTTSRRSAARRWPGPAGAARRRRGRERHGRRGLHRRALIGEGAEVVGVFVLIDMREVVDTVTSVAADASRPQSVSTYLEVLDARHRQRPARPRPPRAHRRRDRAPLGSARAPGGGPPAPRGVELGPARHPERSQCSQGNLRARPSSERPLPA